MSGRLKAGTAKVDITAPFTVPYLGYVPRQAYFEGVHDRLCARALYLDLEGDAAAVITLDMLGVSKNLPDGDLRLRVLDRVGERLNLTSDTLLFCASHAHSTPELAGITSLSHLDEARAWLNDLAADLAGCLVDAASASQPAEVRIGRGAIETISANRRVLDKNGALYKPPDRIPSEDMARPAPIDPDVNVVRFDFADGSHSAILNFTCHPTTVQVNPLVSADYPGVAAKAVEDNSEGCRECLFIQGTCGDINPIGGSNVPDFEAVESNGDALGRETVRVLDEIARLEPSSEEPLRVSVRDVEFPRRDLPGPSPLSEHIQDALASAYDSLRRLGEAESRDRVDELAEAAMQSVVASRVMTERLSEIAKGHDPIGSTVHVLRLGELAIVGIPGEPFSRLGMAIKSRSPAGLTICAGYTNDFVGYLSDSESFAEGGYEVSLGPWCPVGPRGGAVAVRAALEQLAELWA